MRMRLPSALVLLQRLVHNHKNKPVKEPNKMPIRVKPKRQNPLIRYLHLKRHRKRIRQKRRPHNVLAVRRW